MPKFQPNAKIESASNWGTRVIITLEDGTKLDLQKDENGVSIFYDVVTMAESAHNKVTARTISASDLFDYLHDLTQ